MDPDAALTRIRELTQELIEQQGPLTRASRALLLRRADELADLVDWLDAWLRSGGLLPRDWQRRKR